MSALSEFSFDLCFIRPAESRCSDRRFGESVEAALSRLFEPYGRWSLQTKSEGLLDIVIAEMKGIAPWRDEDEVLTYLDEKADDRFWEWLQGYQLRVERKEDAGCCQCKH